MRHPLLLHSSVIKQLPYTKYSNITQPPPRAQRAYFCLARPKHKTHAENMSSSQKHKLHCTCAATLTSTRQIPSEDASCQVLFYKIFGVSSRSCVPDALFMKFVPLMIRHYVFEMNSRYSVSSH